MAAAQPSLLSITTTDDGAVEVHINDQKLSETCWRRCQLLVEMVDGCEQDGLESTIPIPPVCISLWLIASEGLEADVDALCTIVKVQCCGYAV